MRKFNITGLCGIEDDYMVDMSSKIAKIKSLVYDRTYFSVGSTQKCGKSTILAALERELKHKYMVASINLNQPGADYLESQEQFCCEFVWQVTDALNFISSDREYIAKWSNYVSSDFDSLSSHIGEMCRGRKIVLIIDNVDITNELFIDFMNMLGERYILRENGEDDRTFHSVILAEISSRKNIELPATINKKPWNIMRDNKIEMAFSAAEIAAMLKEYEAEHKTGMDITEISEELFNYTSGYLFLVSGICKYIDEELGKHWTAKGIDKAMKIFLKKNC